MKKFFSYDGLFLRILTKIGELIILDIVFLLCCVLVVTSGPALISLYYAIVKCIRRDCGSILKEFFSSMKRVMLKGCLYMLVILLWMVILVFSRDYAMEQNVVALKSVCDVMIVLTIAVVTYLFPVLSRFSVKTGKTLLLAFSMSMRYIYFTIPIVFGTMALVYVLANGIVPAPCLFFAPAIWYFLCSFMIEPALLHYMPPREEGDESWYYPAIDPEKEAQKEEREKLRKESREKARLQREARREKERIDKMRKSQERGKK